MRLIERNWPSCSMFHCWYDRRLAANTFGSVRRHVPAHPHRALSLLFNVSSSVYFRFLSLGFDLERIWPGICLRRVFTRAANTLDVMEKSIYTEEKTQILLSSSCKQHSSSLSRHICFAFHRQATRSSGRRPTVFWHELHCRRSALLLWCYSIILPEFISQWIQRRCMSSSQGRAKVHDFRSEERQHITFCSRGMERAGSLRERSYWGVL